MQFLIAIPKTSPGRDVEFELYFKVYLAVCVFFVLIEVNVASMYVEIKGLFELK